MTNINQTSVKTLKKSKAWFALLIVCILILIGVSGYLIYAKNLLRDIVINNVAKTDDASDIIANNTTNTTDNQSTAVNSQASAGWKEYELSECGISVQVPEDWVIEQSDINVSREKNISAIYNLTSPEFLADLKRSEQESTAVFEGMTNDLTINCYKSLESLTKQWWDLNRKDESNLEYPQNLEDALTRTGLVGKNHESIDPMPIMGISDVQKVEVGGKKSLVGYQIGGPGAVLTYYFENPKNGIIISFESEMTEYQEKKLKQPHLKTVESFEWLD